MILERLRCDRGVFLLSRDGVLKKASGGFTLIEILVACVVFAILVALLLSALGQTSSITQRANQSLAATQTARGAFDLIARNVSQATLMSYWDYQDSNGNFRTEENRAGFQPANYGRNSELHFVIGNAGANSWPGTTGTGQAIAFQLPSDYAVTDANRGLTTLLSACGYYIEYGAREPLPSPFSESTPIYRYRLMQALEPAEDLAVYDTPTGRAWANALSANAVPVADNVVYLLLWPRKSQSEDTDGDVLSGDFSYDSRADVSANPQPETANQLPPVLQVTLVSIDESSATRFCTGSTPPMEIASAFAGLFRNARQSQFEADLTTLETRFSEADIGFRIFTTLVPLRESKME